MVQEEKVYYDVRMGAFSAALSVLKNVDDAEDVAQNVCLKFLQKRDTIDNPKSWSTVVARNESFAFCKKRNIELSGFNCGLDILHAEKIAEAEEINPEFETISREEAKELLSKDDYSFYKLLIKYQQDVNKIMKATKRSKSYVYGASYRVKRNLKAAKLLKEGYRGTRDIVSYNLHQNILNFIKALKRNMQNNSLSKMHNYFREIDISKVPNFDITIVFDYQLHLLKDRSYDLLIPYKNSNNEVKFCILLFKINKLNEIIITKIYHKPSKVLAVKGTEIMDEFKEMKKGLYVKTKKEAKDIFINKYSATEIE